MSGSIRLYGSTSGFVELQAPAVAADNTVNIGDIPQFAGVPSDGDLMRYDAAAGDWRLVGGGYVYAGQVRFTSDGTFSKADPLGTGDIGLRAIRVRMVGGGGSGGGPTTGFPAGGGGGGGAAYAESFITDIASLASSVSVTCALGEPSGTGARSGGGTSSFATTLVVANGAGAEGDPQTGSPGGAGGTGDLVIAGQGGGSGSFGSTLNGVGGSSVLGGGSRATNNFPTNAGGQNAPSGGFGGGGNGARCHSASSVGGAGGAGIVIVDCYV